MYILQLFAVNFFLIELRPSRGSDAKKLCKEDFISVCTIVSHYAALSFRHC